MAKQFCIYGKPEGQAKYDQLIADGWEPVIEGEITVLFEKESSCNPEINVHTKLE